MEIDRDALADPMAKSFLQAILHLELEAVDKEKQKKAEQDRWRKTEKELKGKYLNKRNCGADEDQSSQNIRPEDGGLESSPDFK